MNRSIYSGVLAATLAFLAGCPGEEDSVFCPTTGIVCPKDYFCAAAQPVCLTSLCGNGTTDVGEACDDGNIIDGDGCNNACKREVCGDNKQDVGEFCDDGNTTGGDSCSANCTVESCGNGTTDVGEACDDGNQDNQDGCTGTPIEINDTMGGTMISPEPCSSTEVCGNGLKDFQVGEVCDDGNTTSGDGCNSDCRSGEGCGNGILDPGEDCDDGNSMETDACRTGDYNNDGKGDCKRNVCGDGIVRANFEQCDKGLSAVNPVPRETGPVGADPGCNIDCTLALCDDFKVNRTAGEECDNGPGNSNPNNTGNDNSNNCTSGCTLNICGDSLVDDQSPRTEECDDMNNINNDGCSNACTSAMCGNSVVDLGEDCDDGNGTGTDACVSCRFPKCNDTFIQTGVETCEDGNTASGDGCSSACTLELCHDGTQNPQEECDDGNVFNTDNCVGNCVVAFCGDGFTRAGVEQCDPPQTGVCSPTCQSEGCGNGVLDPGEACDDGCLVSAAPGCTAADNGDGCDQSCRFENCGNGRIDTGEDCDGTGSTTVIGTPGETAACNADCTFTDCGDGKVNASATEQCDNLDPNTGAPLNADSRDCTANCRINVCGDTLINTDGPANTETCDDGNGNNTDGCTNLCRSGSCGDGILDGPSPANPTGEECDLGNANNSDTGACTLSCKLAVCGDNNIRQGVEECDGAPVVVGGITYQCTTTASLTQGCRLRRCGNGIINPNANTTINETCDNDVVPAGGALPQANDGCSTTCKVEVCGDGITNQADNDPATFLPREQCDTGGAIDSATCNRNCTNPRCGDGVLNVLADVQGTMPVVKEQCDDGDNDPNDGCSANCRLESCGDGLLQTSEQCDGTLGLQPCNTTTCRQMTCGNGFVDVFPMTGGQAAVNEQCDLGTGNNANTASCKANCTLNTCGDGFQGPGEQCDSGGSNTNTGALGTCTTTCDFQYCGDGLDGLAEDCDDGNAVNTDTCTNACRNVACGDAIVSSTEACDYGVIDGVSNNNANLPLACPYGTSCMICNDGCGGTATIFERCGDNIMQPEEDCDGADVPTCASFGFSSGTVTCNGSCVASTTGCSFACGNGVRETGEACDDASSASPGCNASCTAVENGYRCTESVAGLSTCSSVCGDGINVAGELCDDGGATGGCNSTCNAVDAGFTCPAAGACTTTCGDGIRAGAEVCDDDNADACGTCNATCTAVSLFTAATGIIVTPAGSAILDGEKFTISNGVSTTVYEFEAVDDPAFIVGGGPILITINGTDTPAQVAAKIVTATSPTTGINATNVAGIPIVNLTNVLAGVEGNSNDNATTVVHPGFVITEMTGGVGDRCAAATECTVAADCESNVCTGTVPNATCAL